MGNFEWIVAGFSIFTGIAGAACTVILPVMILGGIGYLLYKRNQQSGAARQIAQSWPSTSGTVLMSSVQSHRSDEAIPLIPLLFINMKLMEKPIKTKSSKRANNL